MKKIIPFSLALLALLGSACNKSNDVTKRPNNNEVKATVLLSSGQTISINATGSKALMGLSGNLGSPGYIDGTNEANAAVYINVYPSISSTGTFDRAHGYICEYRPNTASTSSPIYTNATGNSGSIIFTTVTDKYIEGSFTARCFTVTDLVMVSGTFKGDYFGF